MCASVLGGSVEPLATLPCFAVASGSKVRLCDDASPCQKWHKRPAGSQPFLLGSGLVHKPLCSGKGVMARSKMGLLCSLSIHRNQSWEGFFSSKIYQDYGSLLYFSTSSCDINTYAKITLTSKGPGVRAAGYFLRCCRHGRLSLKKAPIFSAVLQCCGTWKVLQFTFIYFFYRFPVLSYTYSANDWGSQAL